MVRLRKRVTPRNDLALHGPKINDSDPFDMELPIPGANITRIWMEKRAGRRMPAEPGNR